MDLSLYGLAALIESDTTQINEVPVFAQLTDNSYLSSTHPRFFEISHSYLTFQPLGLTRMSTIFCDFFSSLKLSVKFGKKIMFYDFPILVRKNYRRRRTWGRTQFFGAASRTPLTSASRTLHHRQILFSNDQILVSDRRTDGRTDGRTDRQTDRQTDRRNKHILGLPS